MLKTIKKTRRLRLDNTIKEKVINHLNIESNNKILTCYSVYKKLDISESLIRQTNKSLMTWISNQVEQHNIFFRQNIKEAYKSLIKKTVKDIYDTGLEVTINKVAEVMNIYPYVILKNVDLKKEYYDAKEALIIRG